MLQSALGARRRRDGSPGRHALSSVRPNNGKRPPTGRPRLSLRAQMALGCAAPPKERGPGPMYPHPPPTADRGHFSLLTVAIQWDYERVTPAAVPGSHRQSRGRREVANARDAAARTEATSIIDGGETEPQTTAIEGAAHAAAEVARTRAGVLIGSDPGPPPHFPAFIYEPENNPMSPDICDSNCALQFRRHRQVEFAKPKASRSSPRSFGVERGNRDGRSHATNNTTPHLH
jgi:hypothetical protein